MTARQILRFVASCFFKGPKKAIEERIDEMLEMVDLTDKADRPIRTFSGGERQRLGIAQAQVNYPDLLILDESASSLDPLGRRDVLEGMFRLRKYTTVFYSTYILDHVQRVSDTVIILDKGQLVTQRPIRGKYNFYLGSDYYKSIGAGYRESIERLPKKQPFDDPKAQLLSDGKQGDIGYSAISNNLILWR